MAKEILYVNGLTSWDRYPDKTLPKLFMVDSDPVNERHVFDGGLLFRLGLIDDPEKTGVLLHNRQPKTAWKFKYATAEDIGEGRGFSSYDPQGSHAAESIRDAIIYTGSIEGIELEDDPEPMRVLGVEVAPFRNEPSGIKTIKLAILSQGSEVLTGNEAVERIVREHEAYGYLAEQLKRGTNH